jgi:hypothetical protein
MSRRKRNGNITIGQGHCVSVLLLSLAILNPTKQQLDNWISPSSGEVRVTSTFRAPSVV